MTFCGSDVQVKFDVNGVSGKECFKNFENGFYKNKEITTRHPNIVRSVIIGKKSWGLWVKEWTNGIVEGSFTKQEILDEFREIDLPESLLIEFNNSIKNKIEYEIKKCRENNGSSIDEKFDNGENITKYLEPSVKDLVKGTTAKFSYFCAGNMYYTIDYNGSTYLFHISTEPNEVGLGEFYNEMKAIYLMRWIRKCQESGELIKIN